MGEREGVLAVFGGGMLNLKSKCRGHEVLGREDRKQDAKEHGQFIKTESAAFIIKQNNTLHLERLQSSALDTWGESCRLYTFSLQ